MLFKSKHSIKLSIVQENRTPSPKMMILALFLSCAVAGSLACNNIPCDDPTLGRAMREVSYLPNEEELKTLCPKVMSFLECEKGHLECSGRSIDELVTSSNKMEAGKAKALLGGISVVRDVCDEDSSIHRDYVSSVSCFKENFFSIAGTCRPGPGDGPVPPDPVDHFIKHIYPDTYGGDMDDKTFAEIRCLRASYEVVCILDKLGDACGSVAGRLARNGFLRFKGVLGAGNCDTVENTADLQSRFLDYLELDSQRRVSTQEIFDLFLRRR